MKVTSNQFGGAGQKIMLADGAIPLVFTVPEAAKLLRIGNNRYYELVRCGRLRSVRNGKRILIPKVAIFEFLGMPDETPA